MLTRLEAERSEVNLNKILVNLAAKKPLYLQINYNRRLVQPALHVGPKQRMLRGHKYGIMRPEI